MYENAWQDYYYCYYYYKTVVITTTSPFKYKYKTLCCYYPHDAALNSMKPTILLPVCKS